MNDYRSLLQQVADRAEPGGLPSPAAVRAAGARRTRRTAAAGAAALVAATLVGAVALGTGGGDTRPTPPPIAPSDSTPDRTESTAPGEAERVAVEPGTDGIHLRAVAVRDGRFVVATDTSYAGLPRPIWWSDDARTWHHATEGPEFPNVWDVAAFDDGFVALAPQGMRASTAWVSTDGDHWEQTTVPPGFQATAVASTRAGLFAFDERTLFHSPDGQSWEQVADQPEAPPRGTICFVEDVGDTVVLGAVTNLRRPRTWALEDGTWRPYPESPVTSRTCTRHHYQHAAADGPDATVEIKLWGDDDNVVFVTDR